MSNAQIACAYTARATGQTVADLAALLAAVPLDLALPRLWGVVPISDATTQAPPDTTRAIVMRIGTGGTFAGVAKTDGGEKRSPIRSCTVPGGIASNFGAPPILSFSDATGAGASAVAVCGAGTVFVVNGGGSYTAGVTGRVINGNLAPGGVDATVTVTEGGGVITGVTVVTAGSGYTTFGEIEFTDPSGSGAIAYVALKPVAIVMEQLGQGYSAPSLVVTPFFADCAPDTSNQEGCFKNWMTTVLAAGAQTVVTAADPVIS